MKTGALGIIIIALSCEGYAGTISLLPSSTTTPLGSTVSVNVNVSGLTDLYAFQFDIAFNPAVLSAVSVTEGGLFSSVGVFFTPGTIDNTTGMITFISDSLSGPGPGISTNGTLAQITFTSFAPGLSGINLANVILLDSSLNNIAATTSGTSITVTGTPEPSSVILFATGLVMACLLKPRRRVS